MATNILIGLSGGPSVAINASLAGIMEAAVTSDRIGCIYGSRHGIQGVLHGDVISLEPYCTPRQLEILCQTPAMALGSCRRKLRQEDLPHIEAVFRQFGIGQFYYIGGNDSMDTVLQLDRYFKSRENGVQVIGVPKTIDNDLPITDHTPGFGSAAKYLYHTMSEIIRDSEIYPVKNVVIVEIMGRNSGWLTLAGGLSHFLGNPLPQIIALPETPFDETDFVSRVCSLLEAQNTVICAVSEGIRDKSGEYIGMSAKSGVVDNFGHTYLSGVGKYLEALVMNKIGCKVRSIELNVMQRCSSHLASKTDLEEAREIGRAAVQAGLEGESGVTLTFRRVSNAPYQVEIGSTDVANIANLAKDVPEEWMDLENPAVQKEIADYLLPLMQGELSPIRDETGLPLYIQMQ